MKRIHFLLLGLLVSLTIAAVSPSLPPTRIIAGAGITVTTNGVNNFTIGGGGVPNGGSMTNVNIYVQTNRGDILFDGDGTRATGTPSLQAGTIWTTAVQSSGRISTPNINDYANNITHFSLGPANLTVGSTLTTFTGTAGVKIGTAGTAVTNYASATATLNFASILAAGSEDLTITVTGAVVNDTVTLGLPATVLAGAIFNAWVSAANTVSVRCNNAGSIAVDPASATYRVGVTSH